MDPSNQSFALWLSLSLNFSLDNIFLGVALKCRVNHPFKYVDLNIGCWGLKFSTFDHFSLYRCCIKMQSESPAQYVVDLARAVLGRGRLLATMGACCILYIIHTLLYYIIQPALGLLLADGAPAVGWGKTFWRFGQVFFMKMAVTRKWKVSPRATNRPLTKFGVL